MMDPSAKCVKCGEALTLTGGGFAVCCPGCGTRNLILWESGMQRVQVAQQIDARGAVRAACRELSGERAVEKAFLDTMAEHSEQQLYFVPYYESSGLAVLQYKQKKYRERILSKYVDRDGTPGRRIGVVRKIDRNTIHFDTKIVLHPFRHSAAGVKGLRWGIHTEIPEGAVLRPVDVTEMQHHGVVLSPTLDFKLYQQQKELLGTRNVESVRERVYQDDRIVYLPVWRVTTRYRGMTYEAFVCGATGEFFKGTAPQSRKSRATAFGISYAVTAFITSAGIVMIREFWTIALRDMDSVWNTLDILLLLMTLPVLLLITLMAAIAAYGWDKFRYHPEIIKTRKSTRIHSVGKYADTWLDRLHKATLENVTNQLEGVFSDE